MSDRESRDVHVAIVNYFTAHYLDVLVRQLVADGAASVTILDNSVDDGQWAGLSELAAGLDTVELLRSPRNVGFGAGHNAIARHLGALADDQVLCVLNPDTRMEPGCLRALSDALDEIGADAVVSPVIVTGDPVRPVTWFAGGEIDLRRGVVTHSGYGQQPPPRDGSVFSTGFLSGAVLAATLKVWRTEPFDETLFLYWEDADLALRWAARGVALIVQPRARVWHAEGGSQTDGGRQHGAVYHRYMNRNRTVVLAAHMGLLSLFVGAGAKRTVGQLVAPLRERRWRGGAAECHAALAGLIDGLRAVAVHTAARRAVGRSRRRAHRCSERGDGGEVTTVAVFAPTPSGGHPEYVLKALDGVLDSDDDIRFVWPRRPDLERRFVSDRINQPVAIPAQLPRTDVDTTWRWVSERARPWRRHDMAFCWFLLWRRDIDVVLLEEIQRFTLPLVVGLSRMRGRRVIVRLHNIRRHDYAGSLVDAVDERLTGRGLRMADSVLVHTAGNRRVACAHYGLRCVDVVPHGISVAPAAGSAATGPPTFLFFGEIRQNKGVDILVQGFAKYSGECTLMIAGRSEDSTRARIVDAADRDRRIEWIDGFVAPAAVLELFARARAVVLPYTDFEAQSGVLHMAIEYGVPVIVSDVGALGETVRALGIGLVVAPRDPVALADALTTIEDSRVNGEFRRAIGDAQNSLDWRTIGPTLSSALRGVCASG
ncbi:glycosyltransferase [Gordonia sp. HNM0687]|uniref:Glycosyltransferase n=1 Tax=Gordonia mangrovi TaxID=2665643 RepID=A0A6L7GNJ6_9ACTN|nr:glycosyltransferase [Gordonia mangrovi]MXP20295.1 glycosyltransferase [Gordonia mangrovi]UVF79103.1 glycosyltransferase [Gordonia mangrovi]